MLVGLEKYQYDADVRVPSFAQVSFGRSSALMAAVLPKDVVLLFQNTGREREETLEFGLRLEDALKREIIWLEYRPPERYGDEPKNARFERVTFRTASRKGEPFRAMLESLAAYRKLHKDAEPIAPWAKMRICTGHLKHKVADRYIRSLGVRVHDRYLGLRADEPVRVHDLMSQQTSNRCFYVPLHELGITASDVNAFWERQHFNLQLQPHEGNCDLCFLKDEGDIARLMMDMRNDPEWWKQIQADFPGFGGWGKPSYAQLEQEAPARLHIEACLRRTEEPQNLYQITHRRWKNIVKQEAKRLREERKAITCACEGSIGRDWDQLVML